MWIPISIPIGEKQVVAVQGAVWKFVTCAKCQQDFAYRLQLEAIGEDVNVLFLDGEGSQKRAHAHAQRNLAKKFVNVVVPTPCPCCGYYQEDMVRILKEEGTSDRLFGVGMGMTALSFIPLAFSVPHIWIATAAGVSVGVILMVYAEFFAGRSDPNAGDPQQRILLGQKHTLWGEKLENLREQLASDESAGENASAN
ncbi:hypothetical protein [Blastopirellula marina]|uniref:Uncharacterized protein n=1 Tax=Blastopirellula marina TaxID=124 RepID=A0A2S8F4Q0_9BACT|nr:hypothetical protein [Blastopirellula marina]PQO27133.1 hypothetical protein C5Y98_28205 [Blastopirellula marina]PTL41280.1 hypothetical protein C5Y97_28220 [Blastopirellula marina]